MADTSAKAPVLRPDLVLRPIGDEGQHVLKDPATGVYSPLGPQEAFLLERVDGSQSPEIITRAFEERFGEPLPSEELESFVQIALDQGFLVPAGPPAPPAAADLPAARLPPATVLPPSP